LSRTGLDEAIRSHYRSRSLAVFGTCAGLILLAKTIVDSPHQPRLGLLDVVVRRNAFGRQRDSCEASVEAKGLGDIPLPAVFIRAPLIEWTGPTVEVLARWNDRIVLVREERILAAAFHPELTSDTRVHAWFLNSISAPAASSP